MENKLSKRGRPKGSLNKPKITLSSKNGSAVITVHLEKQVEGTPVNRKSAMGWINWGLRNDYPQRLSDLYYNSVTHKDCVDFTTTAIMGDGVDYDAMKVRKGEIVPNYSESWDDLIEKCAKDFVLYNGYALQIIKNNDDKTYSFYHQPFGDIRCSERDEDGVIMSYWVCRDWTMTSTYPPVELESFGFQEDEEIKSGKAYLYVYTGYSPDISYYPVPQYIAALKPIQTEVELERYDLRSVVNNFCASGILTLNRVDDDEEKQMLLQNIKAMFTGSDNANSLIVNFKNNDDEQPAQFVKIDKDANGSVNLFEQNNRRVVDKIVAAHRIPSKALIGYDTESGMLGGEGNLLAVAFNLFNKTVVTNMRKKLIGTLNKALRMNGVEQEIILKPLTFNIMDAADTSGDVSTGSENTTDDNTERATEENNNKNLDE